MSAKLKKAGAVVGAVLLAVSMTGCATSTTPVGPAGTSDSVTARSQSEIDETASVLDKQSDNATMGEKGTTDVSLGQEIDTDTYSFKLESYEFTDEIKPGADGDTALHLDEPGKKYLVVKGTYTNKSDQQQNIRKGTAAWFTFSDNVFPKDDDYGIQGWTDAIQDDQKSFSNYVVEPGETVDMFIYAEVEDTVAKKAKSATVLWGFNNTLDTYSYYEAATEGAAYKVKIF
ncbi:MAG: hypothetical protein ACOX69_10290 [Coriobacteriales bacterium]|jgi:hypothetical protein